MIPSSEPRDRPEGTNEIEMTPEMIEAGVKALRLWLGEEMRLTVPDLDPDVVQDVFRAMLSAARPALLSGGTKC